METMRNIRLRCQNWSSWINVNSFFPQRDFFCMSEIKVRYDGEVKNIFMTEGWEQRRRHLQGQDWWLVDLATWHVNDAIYIVAKRNLRWCQSVPTRLSNSMKTNILKRLATMKNLQNPSVKKPNLAQSPYGSSSLKNQIHRWTVCTFESRFNDYLNLPPSTMLRRQNLKWVFVSTVTTTIDCKRKRGTGRECW